MGLNKQKVSFKIIETSSFFRCLWEGEDNINQLGTQLMAKGGLK
jgi:hypothetical protein